MVRVAVIDGQGGGIGSLIIKRLKEELGDRIEIIALGTNSTATTAMIKARARREPPEKVRYYGIPAGLILSRDR